MSFQIYDIALAPSKALDIDKYLKCPVWTMEPPTAQTEKLHAFLWHVQYNYDKESGPVVQLFGNIERTNESVMVECRGYYPHFYLWV